MGNRSESGQPASERPKKQCQGIVFSRLLDAYEEKHGHPPSHVRNTLWNIAGTNSDGRINREGRILSKFYLDHILSTGDSTMPLEQQKLLWEEAQRRASEYEE